MSPPAILLGLTGLRIDGGIAAVSRCMARALDEAMRGGGVARADRVLLFDEPSHLPPAPGRGEQHLSRGSQARFVWQLWRSYRRHRHDLLLFDLVGLARSVLLPLPGFPPKRFAIFVHGVEPWVARGGARALAAATTLLANSEFTARAVAEAHPAATAKLRVVPLCIDPERIALWEPLRAAPPPTREPAVLIVGRMAAEERGKGHDELIEAWRGVRKAVPGAQLWIAGTGDDLPRLRDKARVAGLGEAVRFLGRVPDAELGRLYQRAAVYAMPSRQEGFGLCYAEAMWFGLPCLGSRADAAGEVIEEGESGVLVPYGDVAALGSALVSLLRDRERRQRMGEAAARQARERFASYPRFQRDLLAALELGG